MTASAMGALGNETGFRPNDNITREEIAVMLVRALGYDELAKEFSDTYLPFNDVSSNKGYISLAYDFGIVSGKTANSFDPYGTALRLSLIHIWIPMHRTFIGNIYRIFWTACADTRL